MAAPDPPAGKQRILLAEDEFLVGLVLEDALQLRGFETIGPCTTLAALRKAIAEERFDAAVMDVNLSGQMVYPAVEDLVARGRPFLLLTGYSAAHLPAGYQDAPVLAKPYEGHQLAKRLREVIAAPWMPCRAGPGQVS